MYIFLYFCDFFADFPQIFISFEKPLFPSICASFFLAEMKGNGGFLCVFGFLLRVVCFLTDFSFFTGSFLLVWCLFLLIFALILTF